MRSITVALLLSILSSLCQAAIIISPWQEIFKGVYHCVGRADINEPNFQLVNALRIDTKAEGVAFFATPSSGPLETIGQKTGEFLEQYNLAAAVNGGYFAPSSNETNIANQPKNIFGLAVSNGSVVSDNNGFDPGDESKGQTVMILSKDNVARICDHTEVRDLSKIYNAVSGGPMLMKAGKILIKKNDPNESRYIYKTHPRAAAGVSEDGRYVYFITIDGRQKGYSIGENLYNTAMWLKRFGAADAINLDGGGSSTMVRADYLGNQILLNGPSDAWQRFNGSNIGVIAEKLPAQKQSSDIIAYEGFDYAPRPHGIQDANVPYGGGLEGLDGGSGWVAPWKDRMAKTGCFAGVKKGKLVMPDAMLARCERYIDLSGLENCYLKDGKKIGADGTSVWISFLAKCDDEDSNHFAYVRLGDDLQIGKVEGDLNPVVWGVKFKDSYSVSNVKVTESALFLIKISFGKDNDKLELWFNPSAVNGPEQLSESAVNKILDDFDFYSISIRGGYAEFDELRVGKTFNAVMPVK